MNIEGTLACSSEGAFMNKKVLSVASVQGRKRKRGDEDLGAVQHGFYLELNQHYSPDFQRDGNWKACEPVDDLFCQDITLEIFKGKGGNLRELKTGKFKGIIEPNVARPYLRITDALGRRYCFTNINCIVESKDFNHAQITVLNRLNNWQADYGNKLDSTYKYWADRLTDKELRLTIDPIPQNREDDTMARLTEELVGEYQNHKISHHTLDRLLNLIHMIWACDLGWGDFQSMPYSKLTLQTKALDLAPVLTLIQRDYGLDCSRLVMRACLELLSPETA